MRGELGKERGIYCVGMGLFWVKVGRLGRIRKRDMDRRDERVLKQTVPLSATATPSTSTPSLSKYPANPHSHLSNLNNPSPAPSSPQISPPIVSAPKIPPVSPNTVRISLGARPVMGQLVVTVPEGWWPRKMIWLLSISSTVALQRAQRRRILVVAWAILWKVEMSVGEWEGLGRSWAWALKPVAYSSMGVKMEIVKEVMELYDRLHEKGIADS